MTYENFKKELYCDVQETEAAQGRTVRLLEQHMVSSDPVTVHMINMINWRICGSDIIPVREDMLCILWTVEKRNIFVIGRSGYCMKDIAGRDGRAYCHRSGQRFPISEKRRAYGRERISDILSAGSV